MMQKGNSSPECLGPETNFSPNTNRPPSAAKTTLKAKPEIAGSDTLDADATERKRVSKRALEEDDFSDGEGPLPAGATRSEKKRHREKIRRSELNQGLDALASLLYTIDPSLKPSGGPNYYPGKRKGDDGQSISNRVDLINCAVDVLKRINKENESRKQFIAEVTGRAPGADGQLFTRASVSDETMRGTAGADARASGRCSDDLKSRNNDPNFQPSGGGLSNGTLFGRCGTDAIETSLAERLQFAAAAVNQRSALSALQQQALSRQLFHPSLGAGRDFLGGRLSGFGGIQGSSSATEASRLSLLRSRGLLSGREEELSLLSSQLGLQQSATASAGALSQHLRALSGISPTQGEISAILGTGQGLPSETVNFLLQQGATLAELQRATGLPYGGLSSAPGQAAPERAESTPDTSRRSAEEDEENLLRKLLEKRGLLGRRPFPPS